MSEAPALSERIAQITAHRACCGAEHDPANGKLHGCCVVCGVPWPCEYAGTPPRPYRSRVMSDVRHQTPENDGTIDQRWSDLIVDAHLADCTPEYLAWKEIEELRAQVSALQQKAAAYDALEAENARLRALDIGAMPSTTDYANGWNNCRKAFFDAIKRPPPPESE